MAPKQLSMHVGQCRWELNRAILTSKRERISREPMHVGICLYDKLLIREPGGGREGENFNAPACYTELVYVAPSRARVCRGFSDLVLPSKRKPTACGL